jgi:hypothetical protein
LKLLTNGRCCRLCGKNGFKPFSLNNILLKLWALRGAKESQEAAIHSKQWMRVPRFPVPGRNLSARLIQAGLT